MRRSTLDLLVCPRCGAGPLVPDDERDALRFGPVRCPAGHVHPLAEGILDLLGEESGRRSLAQRAFEIPAVARLYERGGRRSVTRLGLDPESEHLLLRSLLAPREGRPLLELSCGTALHARRLAHQGAGPVLAIDRSLAMLREADHHLQESGASVELIRAAPTRLPLVDGAIGGILDLGSLHLEADPAAVLREAARALAPGGVYVGVTLLPERISAVDRVEDRLGVHRRGERELRALCAQAGLTDLERIVLGHAIVIRTVRS